MESQTEVPGLTKNEQKVLKKLIEYPRTPDLEIANEMGLSQQAVFKIRHKMERVGIIKGYTPIIDFKRIGIKTLVVLGIRFTKKVWDTYSEEQISEMIQKIPEVITCYRTPESNISHLMVLGFNDTESKDNYLMKLQTKYSEEIEIINIYPFSVSRIIKENRVSLLYKVLDSKEQKLSRFFPDK